MEEQDAIRLLKRGDIQGLEALVQLYQVAAVRAADLITRDTALAEDMVQTAFVTVYQRIDQYDETKPFRPWFMRIVVNNAIKAVRRNREMSLDGLEMRNAMQFASNLPDPAQALESQELQQTIWDALGELTPEQRAVIVMKYYLSFSEREISESLNKPTSTVKWRLHSARTRLRGLLTALQIQKTEVR